ncbi:hypothetical protein K1X12_07760 [Hyphomonas sp. WL0036]|uniref:hypothetical protein n=1 Tax=Hyphomonas sediminis TaxID=2866160 RepID=UPI001C7EBE56|nr:hypothetical protein [Hyphomonas sediminis]MBY9066792.1 hypothetical protein [Hyphomonas sediminis]
MRLLIAALAMAGLSGCALLPPRARACPDVTSADAWVNRMPGPEAADHSLIVSMRLHTWDLWMLRTITQEETPRILQIELVPGGAGHPGAAGFRSATAGHPDRIEIFCNGQLHHTIEGVMTVS